GCAGTLVTDAIALAYGANNPPAAAVNRVALRNQLRCQHAIGRGVADFVGKKLRKLIDGVPPAAAAAKARRSIDKIPVKCALMVVQDASGVIVPDVGPQMDAAVGAPGTSMQGATLADALVTLLE